MTGKGAGVTEGEGGRSRAEAIKWATIAPGGNKTDRSSDGEDGAEQGLQKSRWELERRKWGCPVEPNWWEEGRRRGSDRRGAEGAAEEV